jgi:hypothetical protein
MQHDQYWRLVRLIEERAKGIAPIAATSAAGRRAKAGVVALRSERGLACAKQHGSWRRR